MTVFRYDSEGCIAQWDQAHADAMRSLRRSRGFILFTVPADDPRIDFVALSKDMSAAGFGELLLNALHVMADSVEEYAEHMPDGWAT